jgi:glutamyl-tRNA reductase
MKKTILELIGTNHKYSDLKTREKLSFPNDRLNQYLKKIRSFDFIKEVMILSTCNRVEILTVSDFPVADKIIDYLSKHSQIDKEKLHDILYIKKDMDAVRHIFRVASSLDSMVVGEPQILGQIKDAYKWSVEFMTSGATINRIMRRAFHAAKTVKSKTDISKGAVSVAYASMVKAKEIMNLQNKRILNIGVGEMNRLACEHFSESGAIISYIANRTKSNAEEIAKKYNAKIIGLKDIYSVLNSVDIVITSTASKKPIIKSKALTQVNNLLIIDMALPRDTEESVGKLDNINLISIDDLNNVVDQSLRFRQKQAKLADKVIEEELESYKEYVESLDYDEIVKQLRIVAERIRKAELNKFKKLYKNKLDEDMLDGVDKLTVSLLNKILHEPTRNIKMFMDHPEGDMYIELLKRIFKIENVKKDLKCFFSENS